MRPYFCMSCFYVAFDKIKSMFIQYSKEIKMQQHQQQHINSRIILLMIIKSENR